MALTTYTTYATIRSLLGVGTLEIEDSILALPHYELELLQEMSEIDQGGGEVKTQFDAIGLIAEGTRTAAQQSFYNLVQLFAAYSIARKLLGSVDMFAPQTIADGRAQHVRPAKQSERLRDAVAAGYAKVKARLVEALVVLVPAADVPATVTRTTILSTGLATDPVTNV